MTSRQPTRVRLRDKLSSLDCLDLSTHSSALLSPFLSSQSAFASGDDSENTFPFRISPTNSTTTASRQHASKQSPKQRSPRLDHRPLASVANLTSAPFDRLVQASSAVQPAAVAKSAFHVTTVSTPVCCICTDFTWSTSEIHTHHLCTMYLTCGATACGWTRRTQLQQIYT